MFSSLNFHIDRGATQDDRYTLFWRDPLDREQSKPRTSSTLILANAVAYAQALKQGEGVHDFKQKYILFETENISPLIGEVLVELPWSAGEGVGEIGIIDNSTVLHASYYPRPENKGYPISVRYLF